MTFTELGLAPAILRAVEEQGYTQPSPIQEQAIPAVLTGQDVMAAAQTGTGKTAGFTLPLLEQLQRWAHKPVKGKGNQIRALVVTPTRELAAQVHESVTTYGKYLDIRSDVVFGGVKINPQMQRLRGGKDILVATPGRLLDLYNQNAIRFDALQTLVMDEADRMLDMGFIHDIKKIIKLLPEHRQNLLFSATFSDEIRNLAKRIVKNPIEISVTPRNTTAKTVTQWLVPVDKSQKSKLLIHLIKQDNLQQVLVFTRTKHGANRLTQNLIKANIPAAAIHGNKSQNARTKALADFKANKVQVLVATDIAARGIDIDQLPNVINFELPNVAEDYVHRIGRTGRAGATGQAVSLVCVEELKDLKGIERLTQQVIERKELEAFTPQNPLPVTTLDTRPIKKKKPKKPKQGYTPQTHQAERDEGDTPKPNEQRCRRNRNGNSAPAKPRDTDGNRKPQSRPANKKKAFSKKKASRRPKPSGNNPWNK